MQYSAVLLAGGKSSRMRQDKALLEIDGRPLWQHQLDTLQQLSPEQLFLSGPSRGDVEGVSDEMPDTGPLGGIATALRRSKTPLLVVLAIDLPNMTVEFLRALLVKCENDRGIVPSSPEHFEPLAAVYPVSCASLAMAALERGEFSVQNFVQRALDEGYLHARPISPNEQCLFQNLNTPEEYERARHGTIG
jgi:molybdopterin-guanine dinucleotide biosynthesis protein A